MSAILLDVVAIHTAVSDSAHHSFTIASFSCFPSQYIVLQGLPQYIIYEVQVQAVFGHAGSMNVMLSVCR